MNFELRDALIGFSILVLALGTGFFIGDQGSGSDRETLYQSSFNVTLDSSDDRKNVEFDNRSVELIYESWEEFRVYYDTGRYREQINTTSDGTVRTVTEVITVDGGSYRFRFRYRDDPSGFEDDFITLYRIERIQ